MRLVVKKNDTIINKYQFSDGPVYIGRHPNSHVLLRDSSVSRKHAVLFKTHGGGWGVEDLDSVNGTFLNDEPVKKVEIKDGDILHILDFSIEFDFADDTGAEKPIQLEDTLIKPAHEPQSQIIIRRTDVERAPAIKFPAKRANDFIQATEEICEANRLDEVLQVLLRISIKQFTAFHAWCSLRSQAVGPMTCSAGKKRDGLPIQLNEIKFSDEISEAVEKQHFVLYTRIPAAREKERIHSAMIAPIVGRTGCFGVMYIDNALDHEHYTLSDLDYLMMLAIHTATIVRNF